MFFGGTLMIVAGILEFILGNSFSSIVFATYGAFWLTFGGTQLPQLNAFAAYAPPDAASPAVGLETTGFNAGFGKTPQLAGTLPSAGFEYRRSSPLTTD